MYRKRLHVILVKYTVLADVGPPNVGGGQEVLRALPRGEVEEDLGGSCSSPHVAQTTAHRHQPTQRRAEAERPQHP